MSVDIATLQIRIDSSETQNATRNLDQMNNAGGRAETVTSGLADAVRKLQGALAVLGIVKIVSEIIKMSDAYDQMTARLKIATNSTSQFLTVQKELIGLSERQRASLESTTDLYAKASAATADMGASQKDILKFTEGVSAALMINGSSAESAAGALNQLGQALGGAKIQAEEYNSILDGARPLLQAVANNIGATGGSVAMLTSLVRAGKVDSAEFFAAAVKGADELIASGKEIPITFSQAIGIAKDRLMVFVGGMNESTGVVTAMSQSVVLASNAIVFMAKNLDAVVSIVGTLIAARVISWTFDFATGLYATAAASRAAAAASIVAAQADVAATAAARTLALARVAELEATVAATAGGSALAIATTSLAGAQARAVLAEEAHIATLFALTAAQRAASVSAGVLAGVMTLLGGPIGLIITALGIGATAWYLWGKSSTDAQDAASGGMEQSTSEILANIEKQNVKLRERIALANAGQTELAKTESPAAQEAAKTLSKLNDLRSRAATLTGIEQITVVELTLKYEQLTGAMKGNLGLKNELERLNSKKTTADWMVEYATKAEKLAAKLAEVGKSYKDGAIPPELKKRIEDSFAAQDSGAKKSAEALKEATKSAQDFIAQMQIEASEIGKSEDQVKMMAAARAAAKAPTAGLRMEIMQAALALDIETKAFAASEAAQKSVTDAIQVLADSRANEYSSIMDEVQANENVVTTYGLSKSAIEALTLARMEDRLAQRQTLELDGKEVAQLERMIDVRKRNVQAITALEDREKEKKAVEDRLAEQTKMWESVDQVAHDTFVSIFDSGKSAFDRLRDTLKNGLLDLLYQMTIKKWILNIGASVSGTGAAGLASAEGLGLTGGAAGGGLGGVAGLAQSAKTAYTIATQGFSGVAAGIGGSIATLGNLFGSSAVSAFGAGMGMTGAQAAAASAAYGSAGMAGTGTALTSGAFAGAAVTAAAGIAAGVLGGKLISGQYGSNATVIGGTGIGAVAGAFMGGPIGAAIGGALGGVIGGIGNRIFGMGDKKYGDTGIAGTLSGSGFTGNEYAKWTQKGGWLRSDKKDTDRKAVDATTSNAFVETYAAIRNVSATLAGTLGIDTASLATRVQALNINLTGLTTEADRLGAVTKFFEGVGNAIALELVPSLGQFKVGNEELSTTLQRVAGNYAGVDAALQLIGRTSQDAFGAVGMATIGARENLIKLAGSLDSLTSGTSFFAENFLTEAEQMAPVLSTVADTLGKLGMAGTTTMDDYKKKVLGLNLASAADQELYIKLLALAPAFKAAADYSSQLAAATGNYAAVVKSASEIASERMDLQKQLNELTKSETELLAIQRSSIAAVNRALFDQVQAAKAVVTAKDVLAKAYDREAAAAQTALDKSKSWVATLNGLNASMALGNQSILTPEQKYAEARAQFEKTLAAANAGDTTAQSGLSAAEQAFLTASQVVNASDARYAADYAQVVAANNEALKWASAQVDVQQASLDALKAQVSGLITINDSVLTVAQAIASLHAAMGTATGLGVKFDGSHAGGLANVPFDGYAAELHRGEVVVDAQAATAMRRYFGGAPSQGGGNNDALVAEIKSLREEVKGLRADQDKQTGAMIRGTVESNDKAAKTVVAGVDKSAKASAWAKQVEYSQ